MAKSSRSSAKKHNNQRKAAAIFGPVENARAERLSARLLEVAQQAKAESSDVNMDSETADDAPQQEDNKPEADMANAMEVDSSSKSAKSRISKNRINKRKQKKSKIVFPSYADRKNKKKAGK